MKKNIIILILAFIFIIILISSFVVYAKNEKEDLTLEEKVSEEISYLNSYIVSLLGEFNGLSLGDDISDKLEETEQLDKEDTDTSGGSKQGGNGGTENKQNGGNQQQNSETSNTQSGDSQQQNSETGNTQGGQNQQSQSTLQEQTASNTKNEKSILVNKGNYTPSWTKIEGQIEQLYQIWNTISIDLHALNIDGKTILSFSDKLNATTQQVKKQEKIKAMQELTSLYQLLPQYKKSYQPDSQETKMLEIQSEIVSSYTAVTDEKWEEAEKQLTQAEQQFATILNTVSGEQKNQTTMNQCYILVNELRSAVTLKDKDIFYIQYQNLINKMAGLR